VPPNRFETPFQNSLPVQNFNRRARKDLRYRGSELMNNKLGKMVQKSSGPLCEHLGNSRLKCSSAGVKGGLLEFWNVGARPAQKSVELKHGAD
jgi:hypothetical protein